MQIFAFIFSFSFLYPASRLLRGIVQEKEQKIREGMRTMGLGHGSLLASWFLTYVIIVLIQAILITIITANNIFKHSAKDLVFAMFFLFGINTMAFCMFVRPNDTSPTVAALCCAC